MTKFPRPHQQDHPRARASLGREVAALSGNLHPALPRLHRDGTGADVPYVVLEYVDGIPLDVALDEAGAFAVDEVCVLALALLAALRTIHYRGLAHIDVKPDNVVLRDGRPVLLDCGSTRPLGARQPRGLLIGSPGYAAPDLETGEPISAAMDVYGVGVTLHEALTGRPAFVPEVAASTAPRRPACPTATSAPTCCACSTPTRPPDPAWTRRWTRSRRSPRQPAARRAHPGSHTPARTRPRQRSVRVAGEAEVR